MENSSCQCGKAYKNWAGPNLDKSCIWLLDPAVFYENYATLYFEAKKHLKVALNKGVLKFAVPFIQGQCTFWPILDAALNF